ncbi:ATP-binding protein [Planctomycetota bacterium]|nr:ATP-binding protein [Planctomycetota bacterium]
MILVVTGIRYFEQAQEQEIRVRAETSVQLLSSTFKDAMASGDLATINDTAETALQDTSLLYVRVIDEEGRVLASVSREGLGDLSSRTPDRSLADTLEDGIFDTAAPIKVAGDPYGRVEVGLDTSQTFAIVAAAKRRAFELALFEMALVALFSFILGSLLTRRLRGLEVAVDTVASGDFHARVPVLRDDEIGRVAAGFNAMVERLGRARSRQAQTVRLLEALSRAQQLHLLGCDDTEVHEALLATVIDLTSSEAACLQHASQSTCAVCSGAPRVAPGSPSQATAVLQLEDGRWFAGVPLHQGERQYGKLALVRGGEPYTEEELAVVRGVAPQVAALIEALEEKAALNRKEQLQRAILGNVLDGIVSVDPEGRVMEANPAFERMFGLEGERVRGRMLSDWISAPVESSRKVEAEALREDGSVIDVELSRTRVGDEEDPSNFVLWVVGDITERKRVEAETRRAMEAAREAQRAKSAFLANMSHELRTPMNGVLGMLQLLQLDQLSPPQQGNLSTAVSAAEHLLEILDDVLVFSKAEAGKIGLEAIPFDLADLVEDCARLLAHSAYKKGIELTCDVPIDGGGVVGDPTRLKQVVVNLVGNAIKFTDQGRVGIRLLLVDSSSDRARFRLVVKDTGVGIAEDAIPGLFAPFQQADDSTTRSFGGTGLGLSICRELVGLMGGTIEVQSRPGEGAEFAAEFDLETARLEASFPDLTGVQFVLRGDLTRSRDVARRYLVALGASEVVTPEEAPGAAVVILNRGPGLDRVLTSLSSIPNRRIIITEWSWVSEHRGDVVESMIAAPVTRRELADAVLATERKRATGFSIVGFSGDVLLVEDNLVNQRVMSAMLERLGVQCEVAGNGAQAVEVLKQRTFQLVLMDCQMPVMDGLEATRTLRERGYSSPIIAVTANVLSESREACNAAGMDGFLSKPIKLTDLQSTLHRFLEPKVDTQADTKADTKANTQANADAEGDADNNRRAR